MQSGERGVNWSFALKVSISFIICSAVVRNSRKLLFLIQKAKNIASNREIFAKRRYRILNLCFEELGNNNGEWIMIHVWTNIRSSPLLIKNSRNLEYMWKLKRCETIQGSISTTINNPVLWMAKQYVRTKAASLSAPQVARFVHYHICRLVFASNTW